MNTDQSILTVSDLTVHVVRKPIKNLHVAVYPPDGNIRVAAPEHLDDDAVRLAVVDRLSWIHRQRKELLSQPRQSPREMVTGESHYVWGKRYRLRVVEDGTTTRDVRIVGGRTLKLTVKPGTDRVRRERILTEWYRHELKMAVPPVIDRWEQELQIPVQEWGVRKMRTKWGSCNAEAGRIWLNLNLALKPPGCLEYVTVHEMIHLREARHGQAFEQKLDQAMPNWRQYRDDLNRLPLSAETWPRQGISADD